MQLYRLMRMTGPLSGRRHLANQGDFNGVTLD
jgi:hypothetical protein